MYCLLCSRLKDSCTYLPFISAYFSWREEEKPPRSTCLVSTTTSRHFILSILEDYCVKHLILLNGPLTASSTASPNGLLNCLLKRASSNGLLNCPPTFTLQTPYKILGIEKDWEEKATKWEDGINPVEVTKDELTNYIRCKTYVYTEIRNQLDYLLWELF